MSDEHELKREQCASTLDGCRCLKHEAHDDVLHHCEHRAWMLDDQGNERVLTLDERDEHEP